jgi:hypothetical protein
MRNVTDSVKPGRILAIRETMTSERTQAYGRVIHTLEDVGPTKLHESEQERIRHAADTLIFATSLEEAQEVLGDVEGLAEHLASTGRWSEERAAELAQDILACGPLAPVA